MSDTPTQTPDPTPVAVAHGRAGRREHDSHPPETVQLEAQTERALVTHGQRRINLLWEGTQASIAAFVIVIVMPVLAFMVVVNHSEAALVGLVGFGGQILTTYFQRTNGTKVGGVGAIMEGEHRGA